MITSGLRDLFTVHGCEVIATGGQDLPAVGPLPPDVLVIDCSGERTEAARRLRRANPQMALIIIEDAHMTVYPAGPTETSYCSPLTEERLLRAVAAL